MTPKEIRTAYRSMNLQEFIELMFKNNVDQATINRQLAYCETVKTLKTMFWLFVIVGSFWVVVGLVSEYFSKEGGRQEALLRPQQSYYNRINI